MGNCRFIWENVWLEKCHLGKSPVAKMSGWEHFGLRICRFALRKCLVEKISFGKMSLGKCRLRKSQFEIWSFGKLSEFTFRVTPLLCNMTVVFLSVLDNRK